MNWIEIKFFKIVKYIIYKGYGYCKERDRGKFLSEHRCGACDASDIQDWIDKHINLLKI